MSIDAAQVGVVTGCASFVTRRDDFGNLVTELPNGAMLIDQRYSEGAIIGPDGLVEPLAAKPRIRDDGGLEVQPKHDGYAHRDCRRIYHYNGRVEHFRNDGEQIIDYPSGTREVRDRNGGQTFFFPDKSIEKMKPNGEVIRISPEGRQQILVEADEERGTLDGALEAVNQFYRDVEETVFGC